MNMMKRAIHYNQQVKSPRLLWRATSPTIRGGSPGAASSHPARLSAVWGWSGGSASRCWISPAARTLSRLGVRRNMDSPGKEWFLNKALRIDDDVAEALYSRKSYGTDLHQIADYPAQEQLQRSDS